MQTQHTRLHAHTTRTICTCTCSHMHALTTRTLHTRTHYAHTSYTAAALRQTHRCETLDSGRYGHRCACAGSKSQARVSTLFFAVLLAALRAFAPTRPAGPKPAAGKRGPGKRGAHGVRQSMRQESVGHVFWPSLKDDEPSG